MSDDGFVEVLFEFVDDEDCCQGEQLVEVDVAVSFDMMPLIFLLFYKEEHQMEQIEKCSNEAFARKRNDVRHLRNLTRLTQLRRKKELISRHR